MTDKITNAITEIKTAWKALDMDSVMKIKMTLKVLSKDTETQTYLADQTKNSSAPFEVYHDQNDGFILLAYSETQDTYRVPHNHGEAWVIYSVASGEIKMGNYFKAHQSNGDFKLILKNQEKLTSGDTRIYYPGEIHDTLCLSENAVILRLTSTDLKEEDRLGRMLRFQTKEVF